MKSSFLLIHMILGCCRQEQQNVGTGKDLTISQSQVFESNSIRELLLYNTKFDKGNCIFENSLRYKGFTVKNKLPMCFPIFGKPDVNNDR